MQNLAQAKYIAPVIHAILFVAMWVFYGVYARPIMDGPSGWLFFTLLVADLPISVVAFGVMFTSSANGTLAAVCWGVLGTFWWFLIGFSIDARIRSFRKKHRKTTEQSPGDG